jgi:membrane-bound lytic murein transglycosylase D
VAEAEAAPVAAVEPAPVPVAAAEPVPAPAAEPEPAPLTVAASEPARAEPAPATVAAVAPHEAPAGASPPPAVARASALDADGPEAVPAYYEVRRGDTLSRIAARFGLSERDLVARNGLRDRHRIAAGQRLRVAPDAAAEATLEPAPAATPGAPAQPPAAPTAPAPVVVAEPSPEPPPATLPDEPAVLVGVEEGAGEAALEPGAEDTRLAEAVVVEAPAAAAPALRSGAPDPSDYAVTPDQRITVHADETIGHYAEWLEVSASRLRQLNRMGPRTPLVIGRRRKLDFSRVTPEVFEQRRLEYHRTLQEEFFDAFEVTATTTHVLSRGDTLWQLSRHRFQIPMWLLVQYNPELDFGSLSPGTQLVIPVLESRQGG